MVSGRYLESSKALRAGINFAAMPLLYLVKISKEDLEHRLYRLSANVEQAF